MLQNPEYGQIFGFQMQLGILHVPKSCNVTVSHLSKWGSRHSLPGCPVFQMSPQEERERDRFGLV